ncbi:MAG: cysteine synthase A [Polyangia bacterium]
MSAAPSGSRPALPPLGCYPNVAATVGRTPLVELSRIAGVSQLARGVRLLAKLEARNPCGSIKDRIGVAMVDDAERRGILTPGATLVEPTTGNTGVALAFVAASRGYKLIVTMPERMSRERAQLLRYFGAEVVETPGALMRDAVARAEELTAEIPGAVMLEQFKNPANPEAHRRTTAIEIWEDTGGAVDVFVAGVGTGGTITGVGEVLKLRKPTVRVVAVEPAKAAVLSAPAGHRPGNHLIQGIGAGFVPAVLNREVVDEVHAVAEEEAFDSARRLAREEGILAGISSGAALAAALVVAARPESAGKVVVVMLPDTAERYVTTPLFSELIAATATATTGGAPGRRAAR